MPQLEFISTKVGLPTDDLLEARAGTLDGEAALAIQSLYTQKSLIVISRANSVEIG